MFCLKIVKGIIASPGLALGEIRVYEEIDVIGQVEDKCYTSDPKRDIKALEDAYNEVLSILEYLSKTAPQEEKELIEAQKMMLESLVEEAKEAILSDKLCSATAVKVIYKKYDQLLSQSGSELIQLRRADLRSLATRLIMYLLGRDRISTYVKPGSIIAAEDISPIEFMELKRIGIKGLITATGGPTSHVAILARTYSIPYMIVSDYSIRELQGRKCILDCLNGLLIIDPNDEYSKYYNSLTEKYAKLMDYFAKSSKEIAKTVDGIRVKVECNIGTIEDLRLLDEYGCEGVGLFRIEFIYIDRRTPPTEEDLISIFTKISNLAGNKEVVIRAPDLGADKPVEYVDFSGEHNPQLGLRGIRLLLKYKDELLYPFIKAFLIANKNKNMKLMLPMVTSINEVIEVVKILEQVVQDYSSSLKDSSVPELGIMVETPAAVIILDQIIKKTPISFISIGTNDLTQYVLAVDRTNPKLNYLYNELHPAVLRSLKQIVETVNKVERPISIKICGEFAGQTRAIPILLALGIKELSVAPTFVGKVKYYIKNLKIIEIRDEILNLIASALSPEEVENYIKKLYNRYKLEYIP